MLLNLLRASHPAPAVTVTSVAALLALADGGTATRVGLTAGAVLCGQLAIGWHNDLLDRDRDASAGRGDKPLARGELNPRTVRIALGLAGVACLIGSLTLGWRGWLHLAAVALAFAYNWPLKRTPASVAPFACAFGLLVAFAAPGAGPELIAAGALLGAGAHFANVLPDMDRDVQAGIRGLPHRLGARASRFVAFGLAAAASLALAWSLRDSAPLAFAALSAAAASGLGFVVSARGGFRLIQVSAAVNAVLLALGAYFS